MNINVTHTAKLANLPLNDAEISKFEIQLEETLEYIKQLDEVDTQGVSITPQVTKLENVLADDVVKPSLTQSEALKNAPATYNGYFKVKAILEQ